MSIQSQLDAAAAGATVIIADGTYREGINITKPVTLRAANALGAKIIADTNGGFAINIGANGVVIDGFDITGPTVEAHAIQANGCHHVSILNCEIHGSGGSGVSFCGGEFITIEKNTVYSNARKSWLSGISVYQPVNISGDTTTPGPRVVIRGNVCYDNFTGTSGAQTDGNGIILDDFNHTQSPTPWPGPPYRYGALVEGNLCFRNGGKGIAVAWSDFAIVRGNTCFGNNGDTDNTATWRGDLSVQASRDCLVERNIAVCDPSTHASSTALGAYGGENIRNVWRANIAWPAARATNVYGADDLTATAIVDPKMPGQLKPKPAMGAVTYIPADWVPAAAAAAGLGWRPNAALPPIDPMPLPPPEKGPDLPDAPDQLSPFAAMTPKQILSETQAYELGTKIVAEVAGRITALRLYRANDTAQTVSLWKDGAVIASGSIAGGAAGWVETSVDVPAAPGDAFLVSVGKTSAQRYAADDAVLVADVAGDGFTIPARGGVFALTPGQLPDQVYNASYYWVDVRFAAAVDVPTRDLAAEIDALTARVAVLEGVPSDYGPRLIALTDAVTVLQADADRVKAWIAKY